MTSVIATRRLTVRYADGKRAIIEARFGQPVEEKKEAWYCPYQIERFPANEAGRQVVGGTLHAGTMLAEHATWGVDGVQALYGALSIVGVEINSLARVAEVDWADMPNCGFPPMPAQR